MSTTDKIFQIFIVHYIDKAIDSLIENPKQGIDDLLKIAKDINRPKIQNIIERIAYHNNDNHALYSYIQTHLLKIKRSIIHQFALSIYTIFRSTNQLNKPKILHFDFKKSKKLSVNQIKYLLDKKERIAYLCIMPGEDYNQLDLLIKTLKDTNYLCFLFLNSNQIIKSKELFDSNNICILININSSNSLAEVSLLLSKHHCFYGAYLSLNNTNIKEYLNDAFHKATSNYKLTGLVYLLDEKLNLDNQKFYLEFLDKSRFTYKYPLIDFYLDQKYFINTFL